MSVLEGFMCGLLTGAACALLWALWAMPNRPRSLFCCDGCGRDIYPPAYKRLHVGKSTYCAECEAAYWIKAAEAVRERNR